MSSFPAKRRTHGTRFFKRCVLSLVACIWLLQLPLPMLHQHDGIHSGFVLADHLDRHHHQRALSGDSYHWHFVLPSELGHNEESPQSTPDSVDVSWSGKVAYTTVRWDPTEPCSLQRDSCVGHPLALFPVRDRGGRLFNAPLPPSRQFCILLCVMRC